MCHLRVRASPAREVPALARTAGRGHAGLVSDQAGLFRIRFRADPVELALFRAGLNRWLIGLGWPATDRQDAVLAINEACDNSVRQACWGDPGEVEVVARLVIEVDGRRIVAVVRDQTGPPRAGNADGTWLTIVNACMDRVRIKPGQGGTSVTMTSRPVPLRIA